MKFTDKSWFFKNACNELIQQYKRNKDWTHVMVYPTIKMNSNLDAYNGYFNSKTNSKSGRNKINHSTMNQQKHKDAHSQEGTETNHSTMNQSNVEILIHKEGARIRDQS
jgi:hypothetical protein